MTRFVCTLCFLAAAAATPFVTHAAVDVPDNFVHEIVVSGLSEPNSLAGLPDGRLLFTEQRTARVRMVVNGHLAATDPVLLVPSVNANGYERGLQGIAVDPQWPERPFVYLMHNRTGSYLRLVRYRASGALADPNGESLTLGDPLILIDDMPDVQHNHNGETIRFGPDGHLYVSLGEDADPCAAQDSTLMKGVLLRLKVSALPMTGGIAVTRAMLTPDLPALATTNANAKLVFAYGLRNPWRFHIDPADGVVALGDVGEATYEELDVVRAGDNLGWPFREGNTVRSGPNCSEPGGSGRGAYEAPLATVHHSAGARAILTAGVYRPTAGSSAWPASYHGSLFYSDYSLGFLRRLAKSGSTWTTSSAVPGQPNATDWATGIPSPVDFAVGRDGHLWVLSQFNSSGGAGQLSRIRYTGPAVTDVPPAMESTLRLAGSPNPFTSDLRIGFTLPRAAHVRLAVFDTEGRRVRTLIDATRSAGDARLTWDGADERGSGVPPGLYYLRLEHEDRVATARVLRLR